MHKRLLDGKDAYPFINLIITSVVFINGIAAVCRRMLGC